MYGRRRCLARSLSDPLLPSSWTRRAPSFVQSSHLAPDALRDNRTSDQPTLALHTQSTSPAVNLAHASDLTDLQKHHQPPILDTRVDAQRSAWHNMPMNETRARRPADPARRSRQRDPTTHGTTKSSKKKPPLKFDLPSLSNVYNPQFVEIRLTPVNRRVPRHLRPAASFGDAPSEHPTSRTSGVHSQTPPKKRKSDRKPSTLHEKVRSLRSLIIIGIGLIRGYRNRSRQTSLHPHHGLQMSHRSISIFQRPPILIPWHRRQELRLRLTPKARPRWTCKRPFV